MPVDSIVIGTAGHVDHGKTELIKALTGWDTDRLAEEKRRGISIVLGFAPLDLGGGVRAGVIDVPGHERFVKNMVSGSVGVDLALLVVAADEGVMPQTEEHLEVLRLLGVRHCVVAVTKIDLVEEEIVQIVESEVGDLLSGTPLKNAPFARTSIVTGSGIDELRALLGEAAKKVERTGANDFFRMPVDRVFTRTGIGTIVTGTTWTGKVGKGDELVVEPLERRVRVREVQSFDEAIGRASAGIRAALALHGVRVADVPLGSQVLTPGKLERASILNTAVEISTIAGSGLKNRQRVRFHHAAAEILARAILLDKENMAPGDRGYVQLRLERPTVARRGDRFVLRSYSPMRVIGGGRILDPAAVKAKRFRSETIETLGSLDSGSPGDVVLTVSSIGGSRGISRGELVPFGLTEAEAESTASSLEKDGLVAIVGDRIVAKVVLDAAFRTLIGEIERFLSDNPLRWGMDREELKARTSLGEGPLFDFLLERGTGDGTLHIRGGLIRAGGRERDLSEGDRKILSGLEERIRGSGFAFANEADLRGIAANDKLLRSYIRILQEDGKIVRVSPGCYMDRAHFDEVLRRLAARLGESDSITVGDFKEMFGFSRKFAVPLLEHLDEEGYTERRGDSRRAGPKLKEDGNGDSEKA
jgi:selenocysteine-specific elongation factor